MLERVKYPYIPDGRTILYVDISNQFMQLARSFAKQHSLDEVMPGAAVVVRDGTVLGGGANGSDYHKKQRCQRVILGCRSGEGYELCEGCHPKNHSEPKAIEDAIRAGHDPNGADLYLWGHWWCCQPCWESMIQAGIRQVFLLEGSEILFNKEHSGNVVGRQFET